MNYLIFFRAQLASLLYLVKRDSFSSCQLTFILFFSPWNVNIWAFLAVSGKHRRLSETLLLQKSC